MDLHPFRLGPGMSEKSLTQTLLERQERLCKLIEQGGTAVYACGMIGIPLEVFNKVMEKGKSRSTGTYRKFFNAVLEAVAKKRESRA
jgi:hypothetical protein